MTHAALGIVPGVLLSIVFLAAASGKLTDRAGTRKAVSDFGVPEVLGKSVAFALPAAELTVAILLLSGSTRLAGAAGALGLLSLFTVAIAANLARGRKPDCHCFGQLHSAPAGWGTLARNAVLVAVAAVVLIPGSGAPGPSVFAWVGKLGPSETLALAAVLGTIGLAVAFGLAFVSLMHSHGRLLLRLDSLQQALQGAGIELPQERTLLELGRDPGTPAPEFALNNVHGGRVSIRDLLEPGLPLLLTFASPGCGPCRALQPALSGWQALHAGVVTFATISGGEPAAILSEAEADAEDQELARLLVDPDFAVYEAYQASGTPSAVLVSADGQIASYVAAGADAIEQLIASAVRGEHEPDGLPIGSLAPELDLRDLDGKDVHLADPRGRETLVLFWNPGCGFCNSIRSELRAWEQNAGSDRLRLLIVSSGDADASRADGFRSTVALDAGYTAGDAFGARGTPMAVILDGNGRVATGLAAGGPAVLALAAGRGSSRVDTPIGATR